MRTRNADNPKSPPPAKRTPPARKSATKTPPPLLDASQQSPSDSTVTPKRASSTRGKAVATNDATTTKTPETPVEAIKAQDDTAKITPGSKPGTKSGTKRTVKRVVKRTVIRKKTPSSAKSDDAKTQAASAAVAKGEIEVPVEKEILEEVKDVANAKQEELSQSDVKESVEKEEHVDHIDMSLKGDEDVAEAEDNMKDVEEGNDVQPSVENLESFDVTDVEKSLEHQEPELDEIENMETEEKSPEVQEPILEEEEMDEKENQETDDDKSLEIQEPGIAVGKEEEKEKEEPDVKELVENQEITMEEEKNVENEQVPTEIDEDRVELEDDPVDSEKDINEEPKGEEDPQERVCLSDEEKIGNDVHEEDDEDEITDEKVAEHGEVGSEEDQAEFTAAAEERRRRKEFEIFVGGLDRDATEEEVKKAFANVGEVVEVRMHKELPTNKNKGYAFVRFAQREHVARALSEMKNPVIHGKRCGTAPSEDNDTLFLGNICNTWTKEAIRQKLKDYGIEGVERITLVADPQHEGLSRGFAFLEFSGHPNAMLAYKRLQKPDAIFGHPERTAKVAFAEPLREPDPEVLAQVKSVFVDGLPPHWDEDTVRDHLKGYGSIERIMLARNMSTAKRKDFGFIDFTTHEAAVACIDGINKRELGDEKMKVRARLSNPLPKTQAVKGGISGGFRIGQGSGATFPRSGRGFVRGEHPSNRMNFQRGRGFYQHGQTSRMGFAEDYPPAGPQSSFRGRQNFGRGGRLDNFRGPHQPSGQSSVPPRFDLDRPRHGGIMDRDHPMPMRGQSFLPEEEFTRPYGGRHYEDPYVYGDAARGVKRPYFADQDPDYIEPSRGRPRLDYSDPTISVPGNRLRGGGSGVHSRDYYNYDYNGSYSSYYGGNRSYGGDRPYGSDRPYGPDRTYGGDRPYGGDRSYGGRYYY